MREKPVVIGLDYSLKRPLAGCLRFFFPVSFFSLSLCVLALAFSKEREEIEHSESLRARHLGHLVIGWERPKLGDDDDDDFRDLVRIRSFVRSTTDDGSTRGNDTNGGAISSLSLSYFLNNEMAETENNIQREKENFHSLSFSLWVCVRVEWRRRRRRRRRELEVFFHSGKSALTSRSHTAVPPVEMLSRKAQVRKKKTFLSLHKLTAKTY